MRCPCEILCFLLHNFRMSYSDETACLFGPLRRALRKRLHACLAVMLIRVTSMRYIKSIRMFEDDVTSTDGGSLGGLGWWSDVCNLQNVLPSSGFLSILLRVLRPSFVATVFAWASAFNGDLNQWDVAKVTDMSYSK